MATAIVTEKGSKKATKKAKGDQKSTTTVKAQKPDADGKPSPEKEKPGLVKGAALRKAIKDAGFDIGHRQEPAEGKVRTHFTIYFGEGVRKHQTGYLIDPPFKGGMNFAIVKPEKGNIAGIGLAGDKTNWVSVANAPTPKGTYKSSCIGYAVVEKPTNEDDGTIGVPDMIAMLCAMAKMRSKDFKLPNGVTQKTIERYLVPAD